MKFLLQVRFNGADAVIGGLSALTARVKPSFAVSRVDILTMLIVMEQRTFGIEGICPTSLSVSAKKLLEVA